MRQVVLDTETTGLEPSEGHRIIEIGCVEVIDRRITGSHYHQYIQPDREVDQGAFEVHGISNDFLSDKPRMAEVAEPFLEYIRGAELVIHNAAFDVGFINHEFSMLGPVWGSIAEHCTVLDSLDMARRMHPGQRNSLDALCKRYGIDNSQRDLHGALLDAQILAEVYLMMTGGQVSLMLGEESESEAGSSQSFEPQKIQRLAALPVILADDEEQTAHQHMLETINQASGGKVLWRD
ncbi:MAG TPA: DNA polymerase III subunit epsilon [Gammaproteobacteria bacterium]|nr:DNA polymerase III subunit epsilon [Gammaproteobacteria bacterium]